MGLAHPEYIQTTIPEGRSGDWLVEKFEIVGAAAGHGPDVPDCAKRRPGRYTRLKHGKTVFMTDLYDEWYTQKIAVEEAHRRGGHVLITGLGLGLIVDSILKPPESPVERITVLELSADVIRLAAPHLLARYPDRLRIVQADAYTWALPAGRPFSVVWHDVWPNPEDPAVVAEMERLEQRYAGVGDWQGSWPREYLWVYRKTPWPRETGSP